MPLDRNPSRGFTLIELLVSVSIGVILMMMAAPMYGEWVADEQTRSAAESVASGLRTAMAEAIKRNSSVEFVLDPTTASGGWVVQPAGGGPSYTKAVFAAGADRAVFTVAPAGNRTVTFNGLGQITSPNADTTLPFDTVNVSTPAGVRALRVLVGGGRTGIKICVPPPNNLPAGDPQLCPAVGG